MRALVPLRSFTHHDAEQVGISASLEEESSKSLTMLSLSLFLFYHLSRLAHKRIGKNYFLIYYIRGRMYHDVERTPMRSVDRDGRAGVITAIAGFMLFFSLSFCWPFLPFFVVVTCCFFSLHLALVWALLASISRAHIDRSARARRSRSPSLSPPPPPQGSRPNETKLSAGSAALHQPPKRIQRDIFDKN